MHNCEQCKDNFDLKLQGIESIMGKSYDIVGHAIIPFEIGGAVDMYYFPYKNGGTGFATMELIETNENEPLPNELGKYELVAFTKHQFVNEDNDNPFNTIERKICGIFTALGFYSREVALNVGDTCEIPSDTETEDNTCLILDFFDYFFVDDKKYHLLVCIQLFRSEMEFAMKNGSKTLFEKLKEAGSYPYSDLDRKPVI